MLATIALAYSERHPSILPPLFRGDPKPPCALPYRIDAEDFTASLGKHATNRCHDSLPVLIQGKPHDASLVVPGLASFNIVLTPDC